MPRRDIRTPCPSTPSRVSHSRYMLTPRVDPATALSRADSRATDMQARGQHTKGDGGRAKIKESAIGAAKLETKVAIPAPRPRPINQPQPNSEMERESQAHSKDGRDGDRETRQPGSCHKLPQQATMRAVIINGEGRRAPCTVSGARVQQWSTRQARDGRVARESA